VALMGGSGAGESASVIQGGGKGLIARSGEMQKSASPFDRQTPDMRPHRPLVDKKAEVAKLGELKDKVTEALGLIPDAKQLSEQVRMDLTPEGLRIQIVDDQSRPMFDSGSAVVKDYMREVLRTMGKVLNSVDYRITLSGHTDATAYASGVRGYSNWELSADRANASRRELIAGGMDDAKIVRVIGAGSSVMLDREKPTAPINRRISITVMNKETEARVFRELGTQTASDAEELAGKLPEKLPEQGTGRKKE
jgi:chemotaxis protein MotB